MQITGNDFYRQTVGVAAQENCGLLLYSHACVGLDCNTGFRLKALRCAFQTLHRTRPDVAA